MSTETPQPPEQNRVQVYFARDAQGLHAPVLVITDGAEHMDAKLVPEQAERVGMMLMELALECRKSNSTVLAPPEPPTAA